MLHPEIAVGHVRRGLLVARGNELDLVAHVIERIEDADIAVAADAEDVGDFLADQELGDEAAALHARHRPALPPAALLFSPGGSPAYRFRYRRMSTDNVGRRLSPTARGLAAAAAASGCATSRRAGCAAAGARG